jgi:hypothetical protein
MWIRFRYPIGSRTTRRTHPPLPALIREYTPARYADEHLPKAHCRNPSILSPAVTATGTRFCLLPRTTATHPTDPTVASSAKASALAL